MKKFISLCMIVINLTISILCFAKTSTPTVKAESLYLRVITQDTPFYQDENGKDLLFYLTYTYYVKVLGYTRDYTHVQTFGDKYAGIDGYVPTKLLFSDDLTVLSPYPNTVIRTSSTAMFYADKNLNNAMQYIFPSRALNYYGKIQTQTDEILYFVGYNEKLGYVKESDVVPFIIPDHPNELTFIVKEEPQPQLPEDEQPNEPKIPKESQASETIRWVIIGCMGLAGVIALILTISKRPVKRKRHSDYFEESDFE